MQQTWVRKAALAATTTVIMAAASAAPVFAGGSHHGEADWSGNDARNWEARHWDGGDWHNTPSISDPLATGLLSPLGLAVDDRGNVFVAQAFAGGISKISRGGAVSDFTSVPGGSTAGLALGRWGSLAFTSVVGNPMEGSAVTSLQKVGPGGGASEKLADLSAYEASANPDQINSYGFQDLDAACAAQLPADIGGVPISGSPFRGPVDSNPYAVADLGRYGWAVADAGGNDIVRVSRSGKVSTLAVLPPIPHKLTAGEASAMGLPSCVAGATFNFDPVPTDVEVGPGGLYVSSLPGGPEDASLGARGNVFRVNPFNGRVKLLATGFAGAVDLAVSPDGDIYVAELFGNKISKVKRGGAAKVVDLPGPAALEWARGKLYATSTTNLGAPVGQVVTIRP